MSRIEPEAPCPTLAPWREKLHEIIFEADTPAGKAFDIFLLISILVSVVTVSLETVEELGEQHPQVFMTAEWCLTILFTIEYGLRLLCVRRPLHYATSFFGIVDLLAILPTYLSLLVPGAQSFAVIRSLRFLRAFRVFKLARMLREAATLRKAFWDSRGKIVVFLTTVLIVVTIAGPAMYLIEYEPQSPKNDRGEHFTSIPQAMYWAIVTMTTVGYGDLVPQTALGKLLSSVLIMIGYSLIIVPMGFVSAELVALKQSVSTRVCLHCRAEGHDTNARHCKHCGNKL
jgi:voltage-gated potassium channel